MRLKLDENIPASTAIRLTALGHDVHTVLEEGLSGRPDNDVWQAAQTEARFLVTQDLDFSDERRFAARARTRGSCSFDCRTPSSGVSPTT
jgi:predicted nuclease of predicted toxin-antitoxin system